MTKPDLGGGVSHPARFSDGVLRAIADLLPESTSFSMLLDPFAGTGRIAELVHMGWAGQIVAVELEPEWSALTPHHPRVSAQVGNALDLRFASEAFDVVATSPTFGNRLADSHDAKDGSLRRSYTHDLGRKLTEGNSGYMQWGESYRDFHAAAWAEAVRVLRPGGVLITESKDHPRNGQRMRVTDWHVDCLRGLGLIEVARVTPDARHLRQGQNTKRYPTNVIAFRRP